MNKSNKRKWFTIMTAKTLEEKDAKLSNALDELNCAINLLNGLTNGDAGPFNIHYVLIAKNSLLKAKSFIKEASE